MKKHTGILTYFYDEHSLDSLEPASLKHSEIKTTDALPFSFLSFFPLVWQFYLSLTPVIFSLFWPSIPSLSPLHSISFCFLSLLSFLSSLCYRFLFLSFCIPLYPFYSPLSVSRLYHISGAGVTGAGWDWG